MPTAPGVTDTTFASEPEPVTHMSDSNVTGIANAARKIPITASLHSHDRSEGKKTRVKYLRGCERMTPPFFACAQSFFDLFPEDAAEEDEQEYDPARDRDRDHGVVGHVAEALVEGARDRQEQVEVDERPCDREEDLLYEVGGDRPGEHAGRG